MFAFGSWQGTAGSQRLERGNHRLPLQGTAGSQRMELLVPNLGTRGYHCKQLPVPRGCTHFFDIESMAKFILDVELTLPNLGTTGYHCKELPVPRGWNSWFPTWEPWVTIASNFKMIRKHFRYNFMVLLNGPVQNAWFCLIDLYRNVCVWFMARNCRFPKVGTLCCQRGNHRLPLQGTAGSQRMDGTLGSQLGNQRLPLQAAAGSQRLELTLPNLGATGYHCKELPVPRGWNSWFPTWNHGLPLQATVKMI